MFQGVRFGVEGVEERGVSVCWKWQFREESSHSGGESGFVNGVRNRLSRAEGDDAWSGSVEGSEERAL